MDYEGITSVSPQGLKEFKRLYKESSGEELSDERANEYALKFLNFMYSLLRISSNLTEVQRTKIEEYKKISEKMEVIIINCYDLEKEGMYDIAQQTFTKVYLASYPYEIRKGSPASKIFNHYHDDPKKRKFLNQEELGENFRLFLAQSRSMLEEEMVPKSEPIPPDATLAEIIMNREGLLTEEEKWNYDSRKTQEDF